MLSDDELHPFRAAQAYERCRIHDDLTGADCEVPATHRLHAEDGDFPLCEVHAAAMQADRADLDISRT